MLKKLLSTFKVLQPFAQTPAEAEAADSISTPEKTAALLVQLESAIAALADTPNSLRLAILRKQHQQAMLASRRHAIESESQRVTAITQRDEDSCKNFLAHAKHEAANAECVFQEKQSRHLAVLARREPLESQLTLAIQSTADKLNAAQAAFDAAVLKGDEPAEMKAAEKLYELKAGTRSPAGPLQLRLAAIHREEIEAHNAMASAEHAKSEANETILRAEAELALVEYDRQAQALLAAYITQAIAVKKVSRKLSPLPNIHDFSAQISSHERIVFGHRMDNFSNRHLSNYVIQDMIENMIAKPDLAIIGFNVEDIEELPLEIKKDRRMPTLPGALIARTDGCGFDYFLPPSNDVAQQQPA